MKILKKMHLSKVLSSLPQHPLCIYEEKYKIKIKKINFLVDIYLIFFY